MKVTVRDVARPDAVLQEWQVHPHLGLPYVGTRVLLRRSAYQAKRKQAHVVDYLWVLPSDDESPEVQMLVAVD